MKTKNNADITSSEPIDVSGDLVRLVPAPLCGRPARSALTEDFH